MNSADFWNDRPNAETVISEYSQLKAQTEDLGEAIDLYADALVTYELAREESDEEMLVKLGA